MDWSSLTFERNGVKLRCYTKGVGTPLLLLHGITDSGLCWGRTADALAENYTVYAPDLRGHGKSDAPPSGYAYADYAADAVALLRLRGPANAVVLGHSLGACIGMFIAAEYPDAVSKLILEDPPLWDVPANVPQDILEREHSAWFDWLRELKKLDQAELVSKSRADSPRWSEAECQAWAASKLQASPRLWEQADIRREQPWRATLRKIACPTLLVYGDPERGGLINAALASEVVGMIQHGEAAYVPGTGHSIHRDEHAAFMAEVNAFLQAT